MATEIIVRKLHHTIVPVDAANAELFESLKPNGEYKAVFTQPRNLPFHRKFFALIKVAFDAWEMPTNEYKGVQIQKNAKRFRKDLLIMAGYGYPVVNLKGEVRYEAQSMSFASMAQDEFETLYSRVVDVILLRVLTHYTRDDLNRVVSEVLGFV
ncbi:MAG: DUF1367 family protein [Methylobacter sp.]